MWRQTLLATIEFEACAEALEVTKAEHGLSEMMRAGVEANTFSYYIEFMACAEAHV